MGMLGGGPLGNGGAHTEFLPDSWSYSQPRLSALLCLGDDDLTLAAELALVGAGAGGFGPPGAVPALDGSGGLGLASVVVGPAPGGSGGLGFGSVVVRLTLVGNGGRGFGSMFC